MRYAAGRDDAGRPLELNDPMAARLRGAATGSSDAAAIVHSFLTLEEIFGTDLPADARFVEPVRHALQRLMSQGARRTVTDFASQAA
jgi:fructuronate reductase